MATYTITDQGSAVANGVYLHDILAGTNNSGQNPGLAQVALGDTIRLVAGVTYTPTGDYGFVLPYIAGGTWTDADYITLRTTLPEFLPVGRIDPRIHLGNMPTVVIGQGQYAFSLSSGDTPHHHWKFLGLHARSNGIGGYANGGFELNNAGRTTANVLLMTNFVIDRCCVHPVEWDTTTMQWTNYHNITSPYDGPYWSTLRWAVNYALGGIEVTNSVLIGDNQRNAAGSPMADVGASAGYGFLCATGPGNILVENNHIQANYNPLFFGGSDNLAVAARSKVIQAGSTTTLTVSYTGDLSAYTDSTHLVLANDASAVDDAYNGQIAQAFSGTGYGYARVVADYVGATRTLIFENPWDQALSTDTVMKIISPTAP